MKVTKLTEATGAWGLAAEPEDYDGVPPLRTLLFDRQPRALAPDRAALVAYLAFDRFCSGRLECPQWVSPALAEAIARDAAPVWLHAVPVELYAKGLPVGLRRLHLRVEGIEGLEPRPNDPTDVLTIARSDHSRGARWSFEAFEVSSNAWLHARGEGPERALRVATACALVYAEDLEIDRVAVPTGVFPSQALERLRSLTDTVRFDVVEV